jgi:hypothetical protein
MPYLVPRGRGGSLHPVIQAGRTADPQRHPHGEQPRAVESGQWTRAARSGRRHPGRDRCHWEVAGQARTGPPSGAVPPARGGGHGCGCRRAGSVSRRHRGASRGHLKGAVRPGRPHGEGGIRRTSSFGPPRACSSRSFSATLMLMDWALVIRQAARGEIDSAGARNATDGIGGGLRGVGDVVVMGDRLGVAALGVEPADQPAAGLRDFLRRLMAYTHSHHCWVGIAPVRGVETHQRWDAARLPS